MYYLSIYNIIYILLHFIYLIISWCYYLVALFLEVSLCRRVIIDGVVISWHHYIAGGKIMFTYKQKKETKVI